MTALTAAERDALVSVATEAVAACVQGGSAPPAAPTEHAHPGLARPGATFVTLRGPAGELRGCIGTIEPQRSLVADVAGNAARAASADPRLTPVRPEELPGLDVKVSVLGPLVPLAATSLDDLRRQLVPGADGLLVEAGRHRATFLPSVWEQAPDPDRFLRLLWDKAGLRPGTWPEGIRLWRYGTEEFGA